MFYLIPLIICVLTGVLFIAGTKKNVAAGLLYMVIGLIPLINIIAALLGLGILIATLVSDAVKA